MNDLLQTEKGGYRNRDEEFIEEISSKSELTIVWEKDGKSYRYILQKKTVFLTGAREFYLGIIHMDIFIYFHNFCHQLFLVR